jgi:ABC-type transport system substrate-binding protein
LDHYFDFSCEKGETMKKTGFVGIVTFAFLAAVTMLPMTASAQEKVLRIAMTAADIPKTTGQPDQGFEGNRFTGIPLFDALTHWDLTSADKPSVIIPGLATEWKVGDTDKTKWTFKLRKGVKFHDGSDLTADAIVWNVEKVLKKDARHFAPDQIGVTVSRMPTLESARKIDDYTVEVTTREPDSFLPLNLTNLFIASPAHWQKKFDALASVTDPAERAKQAWAAFAADASGSGPFKMVRFSPRERVEYTKNTAYWDAKRRPTIDRVVLLPMAEASARTAALLSGQVDWIEAPAPDAVPEIRKKGYVLHTNAQPHVWPWQFSFAEGSPWTDRRVRQAANLCVNRAELKQLLGGLMEIPKGSVPPGHPWWGNPKFDIKFDLPAAQKLMTEAGFGPNKRLKVKTLTSASGSGQMQPVAMNEYLQQALRACYFDVELDVIEWNALFTNWREGAKDPKSRGAHATNVTYAAMDPFFAMVRFSSSKTLPPVSNNWGYYTSPEMDALIATARTTFDDKGRDVALSRIHAKMVEDAAFLWVAHDVGPRAMSAKIKGVVQPKSWFIDIAPMSIQ